MFKQVMPDLGSNYRKVWFRNGAVVLSNLLLSDLSTTDYPVMHMIKYAGPTTRMG